MMIKIIVYNNMNNSHYNLPNSTDDMKRNLKKLKNIRIRNIISLFYLLIINVCREQHFTGLSVI